MLQKLRLNPVLFSLIVLTAAWQQVTAQSPTITSFSPVEGPVGTLVTITGSNLRDPKSIKIGGVRAIAISNTGTALVAMVMPGAVTRHIVIKTASDSAFSNGDFTVTATGHPNRQQGNKLTGTDAYGASSQGCSVAISADGNTAVVGGFFDDNGKGAVWIYTRYGNVWTQQGGKLVGTGAVNRRDGAEQGNAVAISADGNTVLVGAAADSSYFGSCWVFTRSNGVWAQQGPKLVGTGFTFKARKGNSVSLSADGNTAIVGAPNDGNGTGAAWIFTRNNGVWAQQGNKLVGTNSGAYTAEGYSVCISADGNTAVMGGYYDSLGVGACWVFTRDKNGEWTQQGNKLVGRGASVFAHQGTSVAISADGNTIITGGYTDGNFDTTYGSCWVFTRDTAGAWTQQGDKLVGQQYSGSPGQGWSVAISADGNTALAGGPYNNNNEGTVYVYTRDNNGVWAQKGNRFVGSGAIGAAFQGYSVALSADGNTAIEGGYQDNNNFADYGVGAAWIFADSSSILPVTLASFKAYLFGKGVQTVWTGFDEINMSSYDIERSANGHQFSKIGNVPSKNTTATENDYTWFDAYPLLGDNFYRIKAISKDASVQYSYVVKVNTGSATSGMQVYPNPVANKTIHAQLNNVDAGTYAVAVYNAAGQKVYTGSYVHAGGNAFVNVNLHSVAVGVYTIEMKGGKNSYNTKVIVK